MGFLTLLSLSLSASFPAWGLERKAPPPLPSLEIPLHSRSGGIDFGNGIFFRQDNTISVIPSGKTTITLGDLTAANWRLPQEIFSQTITLSRTFHIVSSVQQVLARTGKGITEAIGRGQQSDLILDRLYQEKTLPEDAGATNIAVGASTAGNYRNIRSSRNHSLQTAGAPGPSGGEGGGTSGPPDAIKPAPAQIYSENVHIVMILDACMQEVSNTMLTESDPEQLALGFKRAYETFTTFTPLNVSMTPELFKITTDVLAQVLRIYQGVAHTTISREAFDSRLNGIFQHVDHSIIGSSTPTEALAKVTRLADKIASKPN